MTPKGLTEMYELLEYIGFSAHKGKALGPWCTRILLNIFVTGRRVMHGDEDVQGLVIKWVNTILGDRLASRVIKSMCVMHREHKVPLPAWDLEDCYVEEN
jgi:hypothetical protein